MKLSDLLDTKPFNALTVALAVFLLTSIVSVPESLGGKWHGIVSQLHDAATGVSLETLNWEHSLEILKLIDYSAMQTVPLQY